MDFCFMTEPVTMRTVGGPRTFTVFPNLPLEIRQLIWETICLPRVVELECDDEGFFTSRSVPVSLEVCRESRDTVIKNYPLCFGSIMFPAKVRFNFELDTLLIATEIADDVPHLFATFKEPEINGLKWIAMDREIVMDMDYDHDRSDGLERALKSLTSLKEVRLIFDLEMMTPKRLECGDHHPRLIFEEKPKELADIPVGELPDWETLKSQDFQLWDGKVLPVYGWRKCPSWNIDRRYPDSEDEDEDEEDIDEEWESEYPEDDDDDDDDGDDDDDMPGLLPFDSAERARIEADMLTFNGINLGFMGPRPAASSRAPTTAAAAAATNTAGESSSTATPGSRPLVVVNDEGKAAIGSDAESVD